jgi:hypothetical protein
MVVVVSLDVVKARCIKNSCSWEELMFVYKSKGEVRCWQYEIRCYEMKQFQHTALLLFLLLYSSTHMYNFFVFMVLSWRSRTLF